MNEESPIRGSLATFTPYMKAHRLKLILVCLLVVAVVLIDLVQPWLVKEVIDRYVTVSHPDSGAITRATRYCKLYLMRRVHIEQHFFQENASVH